MVHRPCMLIQKFCPVSHQIHVAIKLSRTSDKIVLLQHSMIGGLTMLVISHSVQKVGNYRGHSVVFVTWYRKEGFFVSLNQYLVLSGNVFNGYKINVV